VAIYKRASCINTIAERRNELFCKSRSDSDTFSESISGGRLFNIIADRILGNDLAKRYAFWYARYASSFDGTDCGMWQYTNEGSVPGIGGNVDLDIGYI